MQCRSAWSGLAREWPLSAVEWASRSSAAFGSKVDRTMRPLKIRSSYAVTFSPHGDLLATLARDVSVWNLTRRLKIVRAHPFSHPSYSVFSPNGACLAIKCTAGLIVVIDPLSGDTVVAFGNHEDGEGSNLLYSSCGDYIIDGTWDGRLNVRRAASGLPEFVREFRGTMVQAVHRSADGRRWVIAHACKATTENRPPNPDYFSLWEWPFRDADSRRLSPGIPFVRSSALSPDGQFLAVVHGAPAETLSVLRINDRAEAISVPIRVGGTGSALSWSTDGQMIGSVQDGKVVFYSWPSLGVQHTLDVQYPSDVAFSPRSGRIAIGSWKSGCVIETGI